MKCSGNHCTTNIQMTKWMKATVSEFLLNVKTMQVAKKKNLNKESSLLQQSSWLQLSALWHSHLIVVWHSSADYKFWKFNFNAFLHFLLVVVEKTKVKQKFQERWISHPNCNWNIWPFLKHFFAPPFRKIGLW